MKQDKTYLNNNLPNVSKSLRFELKKNLLKKISYFK